ncbi:UNKNOWN [Stylonychia lemnae]|uniref:Uncharacterized protein n=1 Tax=Stylonychia lemnae TaxID=5949 RepID=A0A078B639_STYLE|nr:UNKNOWN [Stylonychia lemnae]|eukprot:CDW88777.1 UNKNOWN [Stylonychia lemnae]
MQNDGGRMESLNSHLKLYFEPFKANLRTLNEFQSQMITDAQPNLDLNFFTTFYPLQQQNKEVKLDFTNKIDLVPSILEQLVNFYRETQFFEQNKQVLPQQIYYQVFQEYSTWELILNQFYADVAFKTFSNKQDGCNPRTVQQLKSLKQHKSLVLLACTQWLEQVQASHFREKNVSVSHVLNLRKNPNIGMGGSSQADTEASGYEDFDTEDQITSNEYIEREIELRKTIFEYLRCGKLREIQARLSTAGSYDHVLMLGGSLPLFDSVCYEQYDEAAHLFQKDQEEQSQINNGMYKNRHLQKQIDQTLVIGNRNYLSFINQFYQSQQYQNPKKLRNPLVILENGIHGTQVGDRLSIQAVFQMFLDQKINQQKLLDGRDGRINNEAFLNELHQQSYLDNLWASFKSISQSMLIDQVIEALKDGDDLDLYETFYSELIDEESFNQLSIQVKKNFQFQQVDYVFRDALNISSKSQLSWFESIQKDIVNAQYHASDPQKFGVTAWDNLLDKIYMEIMHKPKGPIVDKKQEYLNQQEQLIQLRFSTHFAMILMLTGRITADPNRVDQYNDLILTYTQHIRQLTDYESRFEQMMLYISFMIGTENQAELYHTCFGKIQDTNLKKQILQKTYEHFSKDLSEKFLRYVAEKNIYEEKYKERGNFLSSNIEEVRENVKRCPTLALEDKDDYERTKMVNWLFQEEDYKNAYYFSNELARKYLIEGRCDLAKKILDYRNEAKGNRKLQDLARDMDRSLNYFLNEDDQLSVVYLRENRQIRNIINVIDRSTELFTVRQDITVAKYTALLEQSFGVLFGYEGQILLEDQPSIQIPKLEEDVFDYYFHYYDSVRDRRESEKLTKSMFSSSLIFIEDIRQKNERIFDYLTSQDLQNLIGLVTDVVMSSSQTIMYELLHSDEFQ